MSEPKIFDFKKQLEEGDAGEKLFIQHYASRNPVKSTEDLAYDFIIDGDKKVELKTDTYPMASTPNFFMERYGNTKNMKSGGPWRSLEDGVDYFVYLYVKDKTFFWFKTEDLCKLLDPYIKTQSYISIKNKGWTARGYKVPRFLCMDIIIKHDQII